MSQTTAPAKVVSFAVPCYNSAEYMDTCVESLLTCGEDIEILLVNDGSTKDNTSEKAHEWEAKYPSIIRAIDQENKGHGGAVNTGIEAATGLYFKVVDSDDWLDEAAMVDIMAYLRSQVEREHPTDMVIANYIYDKVHEGTASVIRYTNVFPTDREVTWDETNAFLPSQYLLMHAIIYRRQVLLESGLRMPEHCFYVDNIFAYVPFPWVKTIRYLDKDMYHYFIGREDQSVNESIMLSRIDQQIRVTRTMVDASRIPNSHYPKKLQRYMVNYLSMMFCICSVFLRMEGRKEQELKLTNLWLYLKGRNPELYKMVHGSLLNRAVNLPTEAGRRFGQFGYRIAQKIFKFN